MSSVALSYVEVSSPCEDRIALTEATFSVCDVVLLDDVSNRELSWAAIDAITSQRGLNVLRSGISTIAIPDTALRDGLSTKAFLAPLQGWRSEWQNR